MPPTGSFTDRPSPGPEEPLAGDAQLSADVLEKKPSLRRKENPVTSKATSSSPRPLSASSCGEGEDAADLPWLLHFPPPQGTPISLGTLKPGRAPSATPRAERGDVRLTVISLSGESAALVAKREDTVGSLKARIAELWQVPALCQTLLLRGEVLDDEDLVGACLAEGAEPIGVSMVVSVARAIKDLGHEKLQARQGALVDLARLGPRGGEDAWQAASRCLDDREISVRRAAVTAVASLAPTLGSDRRAVAALCFALGDVANAVREEAAKRIAQLVVAADKGEQAGLVTQVLERLEDDAVATARSAALSSLGCMVEEATVDPRVSAALLSSFKDPHQAVRRAAVSALGVAVQSKGDPAVILALCQMLEDQDPLVRRSAADALERVAEKGDANAVDAILDRVMHTTPAIRRAAVDVLAKVAKPGDAHIVAILLRRTADEINSVRSTAIGSMAALAPKGDEDCVKALLKRLDDDDAYVRMAAMEALSLLANQGDERIIQRISKRLDDSCDVVRRVAAVVLGQLADPSVDSGRLQRAEKQRREDSVAVGRNMLIMLRTELRLSLERQDSPLILQPAKMPRTQVSA